jgi:hypothetical protein
MLGDHRLALIRFTSAYMTPEYITRSLRELKQKHWKGLLYDADYLWLDVMTRVSSDATDPNGLLHTVITSVPLFRWSISAVSLDGVIRYMCFHLLSVCFCFTCSRDATCKKNIDKTFVLS